MLLSGGFRDHTLDVFNITQPLSPTLIQSKSDSAYRQMVGMRDPLSGLALAALWGDPGGVAAFNVDARGAVQEVARLVSHELASANRIKLMAKRRVAVLPLQVCPIIAYEHFIRL